MKLKTVAVAAALAAVGMAANASDYTFAGASLPSGTLVVESATFAGSGSVFGAGVTSFNLYSVTLSPLGFPTFGSLVETGTALTGGFFLSNKLLGAGSYYVSATGTGAFSGYYSTTSVAAVPEPETYAMMLAGLGVMGFVAARRKS